LAEIETSIDNQLDLTVHIVSGDLTTQEILDKLEIYYQGKTTKRILWDLSNATWANITSDDLRRTVAKAKKYSRKGGKTAWVFAKDVDFGIGRMLEVFGEIEAYDYVFCSFRNKEEARKWLDTHE
jgi:hypothetical protein